MREIKKYKIQISDIDAQQPYPEMIIEAPSKALAVYIYLLIFKAELTLDEIEFHKRLSFGDDGISSMSFESFLDVGDVNIFFNVSILELETQF